MPTSQHLDSLFQLRITLTQNLIQLHRMHPGFLKLRKRTTSLHTLVLTHIAHKQHAIIPMKT
jgi:hypothetical protein